MIDFASQQVYVTEKKWSSLQVFGVWFFCLVFLIFLELTHLSGVVSPLIMRISRPVLVIATQIMQTAEQPVMMLQKSHQAMRRVAVLEIQYSEALAELVRLEAVDKENQELRKLLENTDRTLRKTRVASPLLSLYRPAVSVGSNSEIQVGNGIIVNGVLLGTVAEVNQSTSFISLLHHYEHPPVLVRTDRGAQGITVGTGRVLIMDEISLDMPLELGDTVVTVGQPGLEKDLLVGQVIRIIKEPAAPVKKAYIEQLVDFYQTRVVEIIL